MECLKCGGLAIDDEGFCFAHSHDLDARTSAIDWAMDTREDR